eukprot:m.301075 g.301075  ORF g.301075 m.301075 type:complete len:127 (-) comp27263_c0_seq17:3337-3717(-)
MGWTMAVAVVVAVGIPVSVLSGSNGMAEKPPMSWRSWNQFGWYITEESILSAAVGLTNTSRGIKGMAAGTSLKDLGYGAVGMDEGELMSDPCYPPSPLHPPSLGPASIDSPCLSFHSTTQQCTKPC